MDNIPNTSGIYKITCLANKKIYIGSASNLRRRKNDHFSALRRNEHRNSHLQRSWDRYGSDTFVFEVVELVLEMNCTAREQYWLDNLNPFGRKGFNICYVAGSTLGTKMPPEAVERSSLARRKPRGKFHTPESKEKIRQARLGKPTTLGRKHTFETREKIRQANLRRYRKIS